MTLRPDSTGMRCLGEAWYTAPFCGGRRGKLGRDALNPSAHAAHFRSEMAWERQAAREQCDKLPGSQTRDKHKWACPFVLCMLSAW